MNRFLKYFSIVSIFTVLFITMPEYSRAQDPGDPGGDPDAEVPIDGGLVLLIIAGVAYGYTKYKSKKIITNIWLLDILL